MTELAKWDSFYVIVGSAAGALIGLQFVVMTLVAQRPPSQGTATGARAFATPTIVHFGTVLFFAAVLRAPWDGIVPAMSVCGLVGVAGTFYALVTAMRMRNAGNYTPDFEDWLFHCVLPLASYALLAISAVYGLSQLHLALFGFGGATLVLLFCGIHNAWDATAYHVLANRPRPDRDRVDDSP